MLKIAFHPAYIHPVRDGHRFPMEKYELIPAQLLYEGVVEKRNFYTPDLGKKEDILLAHDEQYVNAIFDLTLDPKMIRRIGFPLSRALVDRERYLVDGTIKGCLFARKHGVAFNVAGGTHHAGSNYGEGFCLFNDQAIASCYLLKNNLASRILIIDLDVHQGNGTAEIFKNTSSVFTLSMHGAKNYPFIKEISDLDVALPDDTENEEYLFLLKKTLEDVFQKFRPDFVFYQAGVDVLESDKLGRLKLTAAGCSERDKLVFNFCFNEDIPVQVSMGGGYSVHIKDIVNAHVATFKTAIEIFSIS
ncbi:histone deacetylase [Sphingobacterium sp. UT-1RO-CII-1]|uniref:histone deacetylase family protein n=1 Tax=Sphingobacterium sp. UT-1RO-CII-1 TaxID=2995225 RepID=UPI00227AC70A|nr:histone deacetylase [Sphingobacterium sp. UT-1RO-CII-1]MCY4781359.1 histone deacetylase [Sphingobacterium sp. UT-1RO-CII-1]